MPRAATAVNVDENGETAMRAGRIVLLVVGSLCALMAVPLLIGGVALGAALATQRDSHGYFTSGDEQFQSRTAAVTTESLDLGSPGPDEWWAKRELATVRLRVRATDGAPVFVGIARTADVEQYLTRVPHDEITDVNLDPFSATYRRHNPAGTARPAPPAGRHIWSTQASGRGTRTLTWSLQPGHWTIVVMNASGAPKVAADVDVGVKVKYLVPIMIGLLVAGFVLLIIAVGLILGGVLSSGGSAGPAPPGGAAPMAVPGGVPAVLEPVGASPLRLEGRLDPELSRGLWLVKWFLAIPHFIVLFFLWIAFAVLTFVAFFAILFTGRYPRSIFDFNVGVMRWSWRVSFYATGALGTDQYPPFSLAADDGPTTFEVAYPEHLSRGLVLVKSWLLAIPHLVVVGILTGGAFAARDRAGAGFGLLSVLVLIAGVTLLFTRRYPRGLFDLIIGVNRWIHRVLIYVALMTDEYPPFRLDQGPEEPVASAPVPVPSAPVTGD